ncbi:MAG: PQQ-dependent sugar dehydrogenase [Pirellulaceae bacterium]
MKLASKHRRFFLGLLSFSVVALTAFGFSSIGQEGVSSSTQRPTVRDEAIGLGARKPWGTSRVVGSPDPPPAFQAVRAFANVELEHPLLFVGAPGTDRIFVGEQAGVLVSFPNRADAEAELFFDLRSEIKSLHLLPSAKEVEAVYSLAFHPQFEQNRQCFICYTLRNNVDANLADGTRISRFLVTATEPPRVDPASEEILLTFRQGGHNGGDLHFGPDGMLYISSGDSGNPNPPDPLNTGQDLSDLLSSILRIDVDHRDPGKSYSVPTDNPFVSMKNARPEIWAYGFRNPWRMSFDATSGDLFVGDVGWELWEMIDRVAKGGNYGWSATEGPQPIKPEFVGPTPILTASIELPHAVATSVTGGYVYRGQRFPELQGAYVFGDFESRRMWAASFDGDRVREMIELTKPSVRISSFGQDNAGELYFLDYDNGTIHTLERNEAGAKNAGFPTKLSQTGLFASVSDHTPAVGVVPFQPIVRQWQDGATTEHWAAFPELTSATLYPEGKMIPGITDWHRFRVHFPKDSTLLKTISLRGRRIETQLLHFDGVEWRGYSFAWNDDQTDAELVPADGAERELPGEQQKPLWQFHSRSQCLLCHNGWAETALAFRPEQLNGPGADGRNQLIALTESGFIRRADRSGQQLSPFDEASVESESRLADPTDSRLPVSDRARTYLDVNCSHCHREGGGGAVPLQLQFQSALVELKAVGVRPSRSDFGLPAACIIKAGDPYSSTLYYRMAKFGRDRMPHLGSELPDEVGLKLIDDWISGMGPQPAQPHVDLNSASSLLANSTSSMIVARQIGRAELPSIVREKLLAEVANLPPSLTRELFDGYLPPGERGERKLGANPRPHEILTMQGDAARGERLFWSKTINCASCHKIDNRGANVGPDLSTIGKLRSREDLLESILAPSRRIEPKYATYAALLLDGRLVNGVLVQRDDKQVTLRDAQDNLFTIVADDVEQLRPAQLSLMPEGQLADCTTQEVADLLEYLFSKK